MVLNQHRINFIIKNKRKTSNFIWCPVSTWGTLLTSTLVSRVDYMFAVCSVARHSPSNEGARPYICGGQIKSSNITMEMKAWCLDILSQYPVFHLSQYLIHILSQYSVSFVCQVLRRCSVVPASWHKPPSKSFLHNVIVFYI